MASRHGRRVKKLANVDHSAPLHVIIPAKLADVKPPLGSQLGQRSINGASFCKDFNNRTAGMIEGVPIPCRIKKESAETYNIIMHHPPATYFLKQAAGIEKARMMKGDIAGKITLKHLYEIACVKAEDPPMTLLTLEQVCQMLIGVARSCGIEIVRSLDAKEYEQFLQERKERIKEHQDKLQLAKDARLLRDA